MGHNNVWGQVYRVIFTEGQAAMTSMSIYCLGQVHLTKNLPRATHTPKKDKNHINTAQNMLHMSCGWSFCVVTI